MALSSEGSDVTYLLRGANERHFSIERVFSDIADRIGVERVVHTARLPHSGVRPDRLLRNVLAALRIRGGIIHVTGDVHYALCSVSRNSRLVVTVHDLNRFAELRGWRRLAYRLFWILPLRRADAITCVSDFSRLQLIDADQKLRDRCVVIENPLSDVFVRSPGCQPVDGHVVAVGTAPNKNLKATIAACAQIEGATLTVVGSMSEDQVDLARTLGVPITQVQGISDEELASVYRSASVLSFPSTAEGFGLPIIEAQGCGVAVVTSDISPLAEVSNGAALLIDPFDLEGLVGALRQAINRGPEIEEMIEAGSQNAAGRRVEVIGREYEDLYRALEASSAMEEIDA